jgi:hypothetical protein
VSQTSRSTHSLSIALRAGNVLRLGLCHSRRPFIIKLNPWPGSIIAVLN